VEDVAGDGEDALDSGAGLEGLLGR